MKLLITADLHVYSHRNDPKRIEDGLECLKWIYETAHQQKVDRVVFAGDLFHHRFQHNSYTYSRIADIIQQANMETIFLVGNHDMWFEDKWSIHSLIPFRKIGHVVDSPTTLDLGVPIDFLPYTPLPSKFLPHFKSDAKVLITHLAVADAVLNSKFDIKSIEDDTKEKEIISTKEFSRWKKVFMGHYHFAQQIDNIEYLGSPMQLSFGEAQQVKHVAIFDTQTHKTYYVENIISPRFYIVDNIAQLDMINAQNAYIQMRTKGDITNKFDVRKRLEDAGAREIEFTPLKEDLEDKTSQALLNVSRVINDRSQLIDTFVDSIEIPKELDKTLLKKIGKEVVAGT